MLSAYWPDPHLPIERRSWISRLLARFNDWFNHQADRYKSVISWALRHRFAMVLLAVASFTGALAMPAMGLLGGEFFPVSDNSEFSVSVQTPPGSSLAYTSKKMEEVSTLARSVPGVSHTYATIGGTSGSVDEGNVYVALVPKHTREMNQEGIARALRQKLREVGGATASIQPGKSGESMAVSARSHRAAP
jgi:HAE1 family hydrophobic/amphiphilic exporter-1